MRDSEPISLFWFRRDLRLHDNAGLYHALKSGCPVLPLFIFDTEILSELKNPRDARVEFIHNSILELDNELQSLSSSLLVKHGSPIAIFKEILSKYKIAAVYINHDYEPYATERDKAIKDLLKQSGIAFHTFKDQVIFEKEEVLNNSGQPYTVFTPYSKKWKEQLTDFYIASYPVEKYFDNFFKTSPLPIPSPEDLGFTSSGVTFPPKHVSDELLKNYHLTRDLIAENKTSHLGVHLRFGTISIRELVRHAQEKNPVFLNELIWREFFQMILWHYPRVVFESFRRQYDSIEWRNNRKEFQAWCEGRTGYPLVDAGMRELNATGFMHNRVRMITASFFCKHLLIDWRWGEQYFAEKLLDYELASNNGNWQWAAGTGCDAAPYFRVFNPKLQQKKFDPLGKYIRRWLPEFGMSACPEPIVKHEEARQRALEAYKKALKDK